MRSWRGEELVVAGDHVGVQFDGQRPELLELARAEVAVGMWPLALLHELPDHSDSRCAQQFAQLGEVFGGRL